MNDPQVPMETVTTSQNHFKPYEHTSPRRQQYGDPIPEIYIPPLSKFEGSTTTSDTYRGQPGMF